MTRFMLYSHDTYGLGHLRRSTLLAAAITKASPDNEVLIVTGSPQAQAFPLPPRVDSLKLPTATKDTAGHYVPRRLGGSIRDLIALRSAVVVAAERTYTPDVILVDHAPLGMAGELVPLLEQCTRRANGPKLVLGLRDIVDDATQVADDWERAGIWGWLDRYDQVFVYGDERIRTTAAELDLAAQLTTDVVHTGYVAPKMSKASTSAALAAALGPAERLADQPYLLVTPGGGGDGQVLLRRHLDAVEAGATGDLPSLVVTGPLMSGGRRSEMLERASRHPMVELIEFTPAMRTLVSAAAGVMSMAGYNTVVEELAADVPALLVPRRTPRLEQDLRARRLDPFSRLERADIDGLVPAVIDDFVSRIGDTPSGHPGHDLDLTGAATAAALLGGLATSSEPTIQRHQEPANV